MNAATGTEPDVIIAGGGLVGLSLALALEQGGLGVAVVDPLAPGTQLEPAYDGRASALAFAAWRMLGALGVAARIGEAQPIERILVTDGDDPAPGRPRGASPLSLHFDARETGGEPLGWMVENRHLRLALDAQAAGRPGIMRIAGETVTGFDAVGPGVTARLSSGRTLAGKVLVAADGRGSRVRAAAGIRAYGWPYAQSALVTTVRMERPHDAVAHELFLPGGPFAILPLTGNRANIVWSDRRARAEAMAALPRADFAALLSRQFGSFLGAVEIVAPVWTYPLSLELAAEWSAPRVALCGDAAHGIHPIAGQGFNLGLKDVAALAETLCEAARGGEDIGDPVVLERYAAWRRTDTMVLAVACDGFVRLFSNDLAPVRALRRLGLGLVDAIGPARRLFASHAGGGSGDLPRLLRGESLASA